MSELRASQMGPRWGYNWYVIICSWENQEAAETKFAKVYEELNVLRDPDWPATQDNNKDYRLNLDPDSFRALKLEGEPRFVIICQSRTPASAEALGNFIKQPGVINVEFFPA